MSDSPSPPPPPDYVGAAQAQGAANVEAARTTAKLNNPNIYSPYGTQVVQFGQGDDPDIATVTQTLTPSSQQIFDRQQDVRLGLANLAGTGANTAQSVMGTPFDYGGPGVNTSIDTSGIARMPVNAGTTAYDAIMSRLEPLQNRQRTSLETQLTNQGLRPGSEAWSNAMTDFGNQQNDSRIQAAAQGLNVDMAANQQGFGQALAQGQFENTAQQQDLAQDIQRRQLPLNEITALMSGSQIQNPQFMQYQGGGNVGAAPLMQAAAQQGNAMNNIYNAQVGASNANNQALGSLAGAGLTAAAMYGGGSAAAGGLAAGLMAF